MSADLILQAGAERIPDLGQERTADDVITELGLHQRTDAPGCEPPGHVIEFRHELAPRRNPERSAFDFRRRILRIPRGELRKAGPGRARLWQQLLGLAALLAVGFRQGIRVGRAPPTALAWCHSKQNVLKHPVLARLIRGIHLLRREVAARGYPIVESLPLEPGDDVSYCRRDHRRI